MLVIGGIPFSFRHVPRWTGRASQKADDIEGKTHSAAGEEGFWTPPFPEAWRSGLSCAGVTAPGGHPGLMLSGPVPLADYLGRRLISKATWKSVFGASLGATDNENGHLGKWRPVSNILISSRLMLSCGLTEDGRNAETFSSARLAYGKTVIRTVSSAVNICDSI